MAWSVHSTMDEPLELVLAFVAHYLTAGAAEVHICLDRRRDDVAESLRGQPQVRLTICDDAYWAQSPAGKRPIGQADRQVMNLRAAYRQSPHDWLLFCDADEFLHIPPEGPTLDQILSGCRPDVLFYTFPVAERFYAMGEPPLTIFDGLYRCRSPRVLETGPAIYGKNWHYLSRALLQDGPGKSIMRTRAGLDVNIHAPKGNQNVTPADFAPFRGAYLVHYDGLTPFHWALKLARWYQSMIDLLGDDAQKIRSRRTSGRALQAEYLHLHRHDQAALLAMTDLQRLRAVQIARLAVAGGIALIEPRIEATARAVFPGVDLDFTQAGFDRRLRRQHDRFLDQSGFIYHEQVG